MVSSFKTVVWPRTSYRRISPDEALHFDFDGGNKLVKYMLHGCFGEEGLFPHSVLQISEDEWRSLVMQQQNQPAQFEGSALFKLNGVAYLVGRHAEQYGRGVQIGGAAKYFKGHYDALLAAALLQRYPASHSNVRVIALHPAKIEDIDLVAQREALGGKYGIELPNGTRIQYLVRGVTPVAEGIGGFMTLMLTQEGRAPQTPRLRVRVGDQIIIVDIGGKISNIIPGVVVERGGISLNTTASESIEFGIEDVAVMVATGLRHHFKPLQKLKGVPSNIVNQALMTRTIDLSGDRALDCADIVNKAFAVLTAPFSEVWMNKFYGGIGAAAISISGGGGHVALDYLRPVINHRCILEVETDPDKMVFANIRGADKARIITIPAPGVANAQT